jgi:hypothetical protein
MAQLSLDDLDARLKQAGVDETAPKVTMPEAGKPRGDAASTAIATARQAGVTAAPVAPPRDKTALDNMSAAVQQMEGRDYRPNEKGIISGLGAAAAAEVGVKDRLDYGQATAGQRAYLAKQYDKYGNWTDSLVAFNSGPGKADEWIAGGRDYAKLPRETQNYLAKASSLTGVDLGVPADASVAEKRRLTGPDLDDRLKKYVDGRPSSELDPEEEDEAVSSIDPSGFYTPEFMEQSAALMGGAARGAANLVLGPIQTALQASNEEMARQFTAQVNDWEERLGLLEMGRKHPVFGTVGEIGGTVAGIMASSGLLAATKVGEAAGAVVSALPRFMRGATVGAAAGATTFHPDVNEGNRGLEGALGAAFGGLGQGIGAAVGWGTRYLADKEATQAFLQMLQANAGQISKSVNEIKQSFLEHYKRLWDEKNKLYTLRNVSGKEFEGFDPEELGQGVAAAIPGAARREGVSATVTSNKVRDELGLPAHEARKDAHARAVEQYRKDSEAYEKNLDKLAPGFPSGAKEQVARQMGLTPPVPPAPFEAVPVGADRFSAALQAVHRAMRTKETDPQSRRQLATLGQSLLDVAKKAADEHGMSVNEFLRDADRANRFFRENIGPIYDLFGRYTPQQIEAGVTAGRKNLFTNAWFFNRVSKALKTNDAELMARMGKVMGPRAQEEMKSVVEWQMLHTLTDDMKGKTPDATATKRFTKYIRDRKDGLIAMLGRTRVTELEGEANIAQRLAETSASRHGRLMVWGTRSFLPFIGGERLVEHTLRGEPLKGAMQAVGLIAAPFAVHAAMNLFHALREVPYVMPLVRSAARLRPGSPELDKAIRQIELRAIGKTATAVRAGVQAAQPTPTVEQIDVTDPATRAAVP